MAETPAAPAPTPAPAAETPPAPSAPVIPEAVLARERAIVQAQQKIAAERAEIAREREAIAAAKAPPAPTEPLDQLRQTTEKLASLEQRLAQAEKDRQIQAWRDQQIAVVQAHPDRFELTLLGGYAQAVPVRIEQHYAKTGETLSAEQAAELIEKEIEVAAEKVVNSKKWKARSATPTTTAQPVVQPPPGATPPKTLTNGLTGSAAAANGKARETREQIVERLKRQGFKPTA